MAQLVDGQWRTENVLFNHDEKGLYFKRPSIFRDRISGDPGAAFAAEGAAITSTARSPARGRTAQR
jgi:glutathionyl-hydroquinone reductase